MQQRRKRRFMLCSDGLGRHLSQPTLCQDRVRCEPRAGICYLQYGCESSFHVQRWLEQQRIVITRAGEWWCEAVGVCRERRWVFSRLFSDCILHFTIVVRTTLVVCCAIDGSQIGWHWALLLFLCLVLNVLRCMIARSLRKSFWRPAAFLRRTLTRKNIFFVVWALPLRRYYGREESLPRGFLFAMSLTVIFRMDYVPYNYIDFYLFSFFLLLIYFKLGCIWQLFFIFYFDIIDLMCNYMVGIILHICPINSVVWSAMLVGQWALAWRARLAIFRRI